MQTAPFRASSPAADWTRRHRLVLWGMLAAATLMRGILAWRTQGVVFDLDSLELVGEALRSSGLDAYSTVNAEANRWPYPPGYFPAVLGAGELDRAGIEFTTAIRLVPALADAAIAWLAQDLLRRRGASPRLRLVTAATVAFGPSFFLISGYHGQIDAVAIAPALAALWIWTRDETGGSRALAAGLLIGVGCAVKTVPIVMLAALVPSSRSVREGAVLVTAAVAVPVATLAPFLIADPDGVRRVFEYRGAPGLGGLSMLAQPRLAEGWHGAATVEINPLVERLSDAAGLIMVTGLAVAALFLLRVRARPIDAALLIWLTVYVFSVSFFVQYFIWGLPFLLAYGRVRTAIAVQLAVLPATLVGFHDLLGLGPPSVGVVRALYTPALIAFWLACAVGLVLLGRQLWHRRPTAVTAAAA